MFIVNTNDIPGQPIQALGVVTGSTIQSKNIGKDIGQGFKTLVGGELKSYTKMMDEARNIAMQRMVEQAQQMGADAIVSLRFSGSAIMAGAAEVLAYGTAVKYINN
ncbi:YbjQ family protein [Acutalibacter sp. 1XD8-36]|uniref:YbjQ family protein n=1 Tax=Acutalibacter sp. 1XD8-36 TaxID=2320852 RepID=UPI00141214A8|nr:YbjQ family protein [Acutalibacter sp. 1XD8-36]NBJ89229.1 YbjQ family protein [Acutalibacter sp. 1XD8-36]